MHQAQRRLVRFPPNAGGLTCIKARARPVTDTRGMNFRVLLCSVATAVAAFATTGSTAPQSFEVTGVVRGPVQDSRVTIAHDEIPGFMAAMTMRFDLGDAHDAAILTSGSRVRFRLRPIDDRFVADQFVILGSEPTAAAPTAARIVRLRPGDPLPALALVNERHEPLSRDSFLGHFTVVTFIFTRCPVPQFCPAMATKFAELQRRTEVSPAAPGTEIRLLSVTLDPVFDQPEILAAYGAAVGAKPGRWSFATGTKDEITTLAKSFAVFTEWNGITLDHTLCTALIGPDGKIVELWRGSAWRPDEVLAAVRVP